MAGTVKSDLSSVLLHIFLVSHAVAMPQLEYIVKVIKKEDCSPK